MNNKIYIVKRMREKVNCILLDRSLIGFEFGKNIVKRIDPIDRSVSTKINDYSAYHLLYVIYLNA